VHVMENENNSATSGRPALIPSRDRSAAYGRWVRTNVLNPKGEPIFLLLYSRKVF